MLEQGGYLMKRLLSLGLLLIDLVGFGLAVLLLAYRF